MAAGCAACITQPPSRMPACSKSAPPWVLTLVLLHCQLIQSGRPVWGRITTCTSPSTPMESESQCRQCRPAELSDRVCGSHAWPRLLSGHTAHLRLLIHQASPPSSICRPNRDCKGVFRSQHGWHLHGLVRVGACWRLAKAAEPGAGAGGSLLQGAGESLLRLACAFVSARSAVYAQTRSDNSPFAAPRGTVAHAGPPTVLPPRPACCARLGRGVVRGAHQGQGGHTVQVAMSVMS